MFTCPGFRRRTGLDQAGLNRYIGSESMRSDDVELTPEEQTLRKTLRSLRDKLLLKAWRQSKRGDAFSALLFERREKGRLLLGTDSMAFDSTRLYGDVSIGEHSHVGQEVVLDGTGGLTIGDYCSLASGVRIQTHDSSKWAVTGGKAAYDYAPVVIEDCCFIGANVVITSGVRIGRHSVIGAGAVVTRDVPPFSIAVGVPARVVGKVALDGDAAEFIFEK